MFSGNSRKILTAAVIIPVLLAACRSWQKTETDSTAPPAVSETSRELPFSNREPEKYQAEIITQIYPKGEKEARKILLARSGMRRLTIFDAGEKTEIASLNPGSGATFSIYKAQKVYAQNAAGENISANSDNDFLTTEWLNAKTPATFENLGTENGLTKFRVRLDNSESSEALLYVDENLKIPVRQEFYAIDGDQKRITFSVEVKNFKPEIDEKLFELPKDYRQITPQELQDMLWREKLKNE